MTEPSFETFRYEVRDRRAYMILARPERLNAINGQLTRDLRNAVAAANDEPGVHVIIRKGDGRAFCVGLNFGKDFNEWAKAHSTDGKWDPGKDFIHATAPAVAPTRKFMSIWRGPKPAIAQIHGWCMGGGSE
jgi:enoyl-CoA hydratase